MIKKIMLALAGTALISVGHAQVGTAVKETAKATAEGAKEAGDQMKSTVASTPDKQIDKAKAHVHKARARAHRHHAKVAAEAATH